MKKDDTMYLKKELWYLAFYAKIGKVSHKFKGT